MKIEKSINIFALLCIEYRLQNAETDRMNDRMNFECRSEDSGNNRRRPLDYLQRYIELLPNLARRIKESYPGWRMRIYHNASEEKSPTLTSVLCDVACQFQHVDVCNVTEIIRRSTDPLK